jgi:hypothetical protein
MQLELMRRGPVECPAAAAITVIDDSAAAAAAVTATAAQGLALVPFRSTQSRLSLTLPETNVV